MRNFFYLSLVVALKLYELQNYLTEFNRIMIFVIFALALKHNK